MTVLGLGCESTSLALGCTCVLEGFLSGEISLVFACRTVRWIAGGRWRFEDCGGACIC